MILKAFNAVKKDLGESNVRRLGGINDPIGTDEYMVAMKCAPDDLHFIRLTDQGWYNKSGGYFSGLFVPSSYVNGKEWHPIWQMNGYVYHGTPQDGYTIYDSKTIYFAVKKGWDNQ